MANSLQLLRFIFNVKFVNILLKLSNKIYLYGNFSNWQEALEFSKDNYSSKKIINKIKYNFSRSLKFGNFYERDGILLKKKNFNEDNIIAHYKKYCLNKKKKMHYILDVGGGTGSIYFRNQDFLNKNTKIKWVVFDQNEIISFVKKKIINKQLKFISSISLKNKDKFQIILLQSSLQYFSRPYTLLNKLIKLNSKFIIIDETVFTNNNSDEIKIQKNPKRIYSVDYPLYIFSKKKILKYLDNRNYKLFYEKSCPSGIGGYYYKCLVFIKKNNFIES